MPWAEYADRVDRRRIRPQLVQAIRSRSVASSSRHGEIVECWRVCSFEPASWAHETGTRSESGERFDTAENTAEQGERLGVTWL